MVSHFWPRTELSVRNMTASPITDIKGDEFDGMLVKYRINSRHSSLYAT